MAWGFGLAVAILLGMLFLHQHWLLEAHVLLPIFILFASLRAPARRHALAIATLQLTAIAGPIAWLAVRDANVLAPIAVRLGLVALVGTASVVIRSRLAPPKPKTEVEATLGFYTMIFASSPAWMVSFALEMLRHS